ncbi:hypothetical protein ABEB36_014649 [Hypothenemus hampei]|uniref:RNA-directed DNA polymerase n=1 Tax=Hypothenemus hampei TaxID=57062 RepID=A0ABD1E554_HYPHA
MLGLLDSGATRTVVGLSGLKLLRSLGLEVLGSPGLCTMANGEQSATSGFVSAPVTLMGRTHVLDLLVVPDLAQPLILGIDFWKVMQIVPDLHQNVWHFAGEQSVLSLVSSLEVSGVEALENLTSQQQNQLLTLIDAKFRVMGDGLGCCNAAEHVIELLPGTSPIKQRYYPVSPVKQALMNQEIDEMLRLGVIELSHSPWASPVCMVRKSDNSYRFCIDFRKLNAVTKKDSYPIPYISAILDRLRNTKFISSIDIRSAFWQVPLSESSKELTAFVVPGRDLYQFRRMPFGLTNAPATWQRIIDRVLGVDLEGKVMVYLDDIIVISESFSEHLQILGLVFDRLRDAGLVVKREKCHFCKAELKYLGYMVDSRGLRPDPEKVQAIINIVPPTNITEVRRFIGTASWYRRFVPNFSTILSPIINLTKKKSVWNWTPACHESFRLIKEALITAPVLSSPDFNREFILQTDASAYGLGAVLSQNFEDGEKVIAYLSRSLTRQETKLTVTEKECLAVIWSVEKLRHYLEGVHFKVITDHHSLLWLHHLKDPQGRLARWALRLQPYDFELIHRKGKDHVVPDFLSRSVPVVTSDSLEVSALETAVRIEDRHSFVTQDKWYNRLLQRLESEPEKFPCWRTEDGKLYKNVRTDHAEFSNGSGAWKVVVPKDLRLDVLKRCHDHPAAGHVGVFKTFWKLASRYYWPKMRADVVRFVRSCRVCAQSKVEQKPPCGLMGNRPRISQPWQSISLDFVGPLPRSKHGNSYILVVTDFFSKYVVLFPCRSANSKSLVKFVEEGIFLTYGTPQFLTCDNGTQMKSKEFRSLCDKYGVKIFYTAHYYPRADHTERVNRVIKTMLKTCVRQSDHRTWEDNLAAIGCAIRTSKHEVTGFTPYFINFGREHHLFGPDFSENILVQGNDPRVTIQARQGKLKDLFLKVQERIEAAHKVSQQRYNLRRRPVQYKVGDLVWRKNKVLSNMDKHYSAKLAPEYIGPFKVLRRTGTCTYELGDESGKRKGVWHVQDLKPLEPVYPLESPNSVTPRNSLLNS